MTDEKTDKAGSHELAGALRRDSIGHAFVERVSPMPGRGVSSVFAFGKNYGVVLRVREVEVKPSRTGWRPLLARPRRKWAVGYWVKFKAGVLALLFGLTTPGIAALDEDAAAAYARGDYKTELRILRSLAENGDSNAQFNLALMFHKGDGVPQDDAQAVRWYRKAADQGYAPAQFNLALMYETSPSIPRDYGEAIRLYRAGANQGLADAQNNLCAMYLDGRGVSQDDAEAATWCRKAADQGFAIAQYNLGLMYEIGRGVPQDPVAAYMWLSLAASGTPNGDAQAIDRRNLAAAKMNPAQIAEAVNRRRSLTLDRRPIVTPLFWVFGLVPVANRRDPRGAE
jgi:Sel1 repeat